MECYRRAMISERTFPGWRESLNQANKLSRTYAALIEALGRHRSKGQRRITVEHVSVNAGGQAIVGTVTPGGRTAQKFEEQTSATQKIADEPPVVELRTRSGKPCQSPVVLGKRRCRMHAGAAGSGAPIGNKNASGMVIIPPKPSLAGDSSPS